MIIKIDADITMGFISSSHSHFITTTHVTTPFAKEDLKRVFFAEIYCLRASVVDVYLSYIVT